MHNESLGTWRKLDLNQSLRYAKALYYQIYYFPSVIYYQYLYNTALTYIQKRLSRIPTVGHIRDVGLFLQGINWERGLYKNSLGACEG